MRASIQVVRTGIVYDMPDHGEEVSWRLLITQDRYLFWVSVEKRGRGYVVVVHNMHLLVKITNAACAELATKLQSIFPPTPDPSTSRYATYTVTDERGAKELRNLATVICMKTRLADG